MPVWLDAIPEKAPKVMRPNPRRWLLFLAFMLVTGITLTFWQWTSGRNGFIFWFTALGLPFCLWGLLFSLRRFAYKAEQVGAESRNAEREALIQQEIRRGQRCGWVLGYHIQHPAGNKPGALLQTASHTMPIVQFSTPRGSKVAVRYAALTGFQVDLEAEIIATTSTLAARVQDITATLPTDIPCCLMLDCDDDIRQCVESHLKNELAAKTGRSFRLLSGKGLSAFDAWLDQRWENPGILAAVTFSVPAYPSQGDADAITLVVLCNRKAAAYPHAVCLHRPEKGKEPALVKTLNRALLWSDTDPESLKAAWHTGPALASGSGWNKACEDNGVTFSLSDDNRSIDYAMGYTGRAAPWLVIILASAACHDNGPQVIAAQSAADEEDVWVAVVNKKDVRKENQGNG
ncbi:TPA: hypothetical protein ACIAID_003810 [Enterobacter hormaechei subsp. steigerwaltii]